MYCDYVSFVPSMFSFRHCKIPNHVLDFILTPCGPFVSNVVLYLAYNKVSWVLEWCSLDLPSF